MNIAIVDGTRKAAIPRHIGQCPACFSSVRSACGSIVAWHWKHVAGADCDPWSEPESDWHRWWKGLFPEGCREVVIGPHRADVATSDEIIELQHSPITGDEIAEREAFYGERLIWVFDLGGFKDAVQLTGGPTEYAIRFQFPKKAIASCKRRVLIDCGGGVLLEPRIWHDNKRGFGIVHGIEWLTPRTDFRGVVRNAVAPVAVSKEPSVLVLEPESWAWNGRRRFDHRVCRMSAHLHAIGADGKECCPSGWLNVDLPQGLSDSSLFGVRCTRCKMIRGDHRRLRRVSYNGRVFSVGD